MEDMVNASIAPTKYRFMIFPLLRHRRILSGPAY
jgi:hypothetical protein